MSQNLNRSEDDVWAAAITIARNICEQESTNCKNTGNIAGASLAKHISARIKEWDETNVEKTWPVLSSIGVNVKTSNKKTTT